MGQRLTPSEYRAMWLFAMFDLPVKKAKDRKNYMQFRKALIREGFMMLQYSVYARYCASEDRALNVRRRVQSMLPPKGQIRLVSITDRQFGKMHVFQGIKRQKPEARPDQLMLF
ncbi:MAG: CRISPR-associated endonuclease Cas2 [Candidatus Krumholzibacteriota bacterium]|nr:CRISPR-associated endonuclease Cas2 [Candidatus Krumholzibacteriota bacterium]